MMRRRTILGVGLAATAAAFARPVRAAPRFETIDLRLSGISRRALLLVPEGVTAEERPAALILLHGLAETASEETGVRAWVDRYGLLEAYRRLAEPPVAPTGERGDLPADRARTINDALGRTPFAGRFVLVCPHLPNIYKMPSTTAALDRLAAWTADVLVPAVRARTPLGDGPIGIDGCSLGGFVGVEILIRRPSLFASWGGVQSALPRAGASLLAERIATSLRTRPIPLHVETSERDPFKAANLALARELAVRGVPCETEIFPGPHDQAWLREVGTLAMLLFHDRARTFRRQIDAPPR
jgi:hypothetical protein